MPTDEELLKYEQDRGTMPPDESLGMEYEQDEQGRVIVETIRPAGMAMTRRAPAGR